MENNTAEIGDVDQEQGKFRFTARTSYYGTLIKPPIELEVCYEMFRGRPVFRAAFDGRGMSHEIELLNQQELREGFDRHLVS
jgi:hypothetical protein